MASRKKSAPGTRASREALKKSARKKSIRRKRAASGESRKRPRHSKTKGTKLGERVYDADGMIMPTLPLMPNQRAMRTACGEFFEGNAQEMAEALETSKSTVYKWIKGEKDPRREHFERLEKRIRKHWAALWLPDPAAIYFYGRRIDSRYPRYAELERYIRYVLEDAEPGATPERQLPSD